MSSPDGKPVYIKHVPWHEKPAATIHRTTSDDPVYVDQSGQFVNAMGEPLSQEDFDNRPKGV